MKYIVYLTTNKVNGKIYIGVHKTENPEIFDGYIGCGAYINSPKTYNKGTTYLHKAILKYGVKNFQRTTLKVFDNEQDALDLERFLVTEKFISRTDTYNLTVGGGLPPLLAKEVYQFDLSGTLIKKWESRIELEKHYNCSDWKILDCITKKREFEKTYLSNYSSINIEEYRESTRSKSVYQYSSEGIFLHKFNSVSEAAAKLDVDPKSISKAIFSYSLFIDCYFLHKEDSLEDIMLKKRTKVNAKTREVFQYNLNGKYIKGFSSMAEASKEVGGNHSNIIRAIKNNGNYKGYKWSYKKSDTIEDYSSNDLKPVKVAQYDKEGNLIKIWDSVSECKKEYPGCQRVCKMTRKSYKGYVFEYVK